MLGLALLWVGAVLFLNGIWLMGRIGSREIAIINIFTGAVTALVAMYLAFGPGQQSGGATGGGAYPAVLIYLPVGGLQPV